MTESTPLVQYQPFDLVGDARARLVELDHYEASALLKTGWSMVGVVVVRAEETKTYGVWRQLADAALREAISGQKDAEERAAKSYTESQVAARDLAAARRTIVELEDRLTAFEASRAGLVLQEEKP